MINIFIIVPIYNDYHSIIKFINSINIAFKGYGSVNIIIGDASDDHKQQPLNIDCVKVLKVESTNYWSGTMNKCFDLLDKYSSINKSDLIILANDDVVVHKNTIEIIKQYKKENNCLYHPVVTNNDGIYISAGASVISWFPYITRHVKRIQEDVQVQLGTTRFLILTKELLDKIGRIPSNIPHYGGDNYITMKAWYHHKIPTFVSPLGKICLDQDRTGKKRKDIKGFKEFVSSFLDIKSTNNLKVRYNLLRHFHSRTKSIIIVSNMFLIIIIKQLFWK